MLSHPLLKHTWYENRKLLQRNCALLFTLRRLWVCAQHTRLLGTGASQWEKSWLSLVPLTANCGGKREAHPHGIHLVARWSFLLLLHIQARKDSHKACSSLWPVLKTDEAMVLGPGAPGSLQGPRDWAGILGLDHSWHAKAESTGWSRKVTVFLCLSNVMWLQSEPAMND